MSNTQNRIGDLEEKIETLEDQLTSVRKVTPLHDVTWYVKWISVFFVCCAVLCRSIEEVPKIYDVMFSIVGTAGWLWVGFKWHDRALIMLNGALSTLLFTGIIKHFIS